MRQDSSEQKILWTRLMENLINDEGFEYMNELSLVTIRVSHGLWHSMLEYRTQLLGVSNAAM